MAMKALQPSSRYTRMVNTINCTGLIQIKCKTSMGYRKIKNVVHLHACNIGLLAHTSYPIKPLHIISSQVDNVTNRHFPNGMLIKAQCLHSNNNMQVL